MASHALSVTAWHPQCCAATSGTSRRKIGSNSAREKEAPAHTFSRRLGGRRNSLRSNTRWVACVGGRDIVVAEPSIDEDDEGDGVPWEVEMGPDGRLAEPLEKAIPGDYYSLLQLDYDADPEDVKKQYRQLQKWWGRGRRGRRERE